MSHNENYIKTKFKIIFGNMLSPTMYSELYNGTYAKTFQNENNEIVSEQITKNEYASALAHIILRENGYEYLENKNIYNG